MLVMLGTDATPAELERLRHLLGLDQPLWVQYAQYLGRLLTAQMGDSIFQHQAVAKLIGDRFPATLELTVAAMLVAVVVGMTAGLISALVPYSVFDVTAMLLDDKAEASERMVSLIAREAEKAEVSVFRRWALMRHWHVHNKISLDQMIDPTDGQDQLHQNDWSTMRVAQVLCEAMVHALPARA